MFQTTSRDGLGDLPQCVLEGPCSVYDFLRDVSSPHDVWNVWLPGPTSAPLRAGKSDILPNPPPHARQRGSGVAVVRLQGLGSPAATHAFLLTVINCSPAPLPHPLLSTPGGGHSCRAGGTQALHHCTPGYLLPIVIPAGVNARH